MKNNIKNYRYFRDSPFRITHQRERHVIPWKMKNIPSIIPIAIATSMFVNKEIIAIINPIIPMISSNVHPGKPFTANAVKIRNIAEANIQIANIIMKTRSAIFDSKIANPPIRIDRIPSSIIHLEILQYLCSPK